jgi:hypothetical protein
MDSSAHRNAKNEILTEAASERVVLRRCGRGHIKILDRDGLGAFSCECYEVLKQAAERSNGN